MPDAEADEIAGAARYERTNDRKAFPAGHYERRPAAKAGQLELGIPELKGAVFESVVIERYRRREQSAEESLIDMCLAGVSTRQVDDTGQLLWGDRMPSPDIERQAQARVRRDRRMAHGAVGGRVPIRVRGRRVAQALLGRKRGERRHPGRHRRQQGWSPRGRRRRRGPGGGFRQLGTVLSRHDRTRPEGRPARGRRPVHGTGRHGGLDAAEGEGPAAHGAFLAQRALQGATQPPRMGVGGPEGRVRHGIMRVHVGQGGRRRVRYEGQEAEGGRRLPARGHPRDDHLPAG